MLKIMTLNLWCYFEWNARKDNIVSLIKDFDPDVITFQEAQTNNSFSAWPQSDFIADSCGYKYRVFAPTYGRDGQINPGGTMTTRASHGLAIISQYPIISSESYFLRQHPDHDEACSVLFCKVEVSEVLVEVCNVHLGNSDLFADLHLNELMDVCEGKKIQPILSGDFNIFDLSAYKRNRLKDYTLSTDIAEYESMPKDNGTLDYIVSPAKYSLESVLCPKVFVSDHRALFATIDLK